MTWSICAANNCIIWDEEGEWVATFKMPEDAARVVRLWNSTDSLIWPTRSYDNVASAEFDTRIAESNGWTNHL